MPSPVEVDGTDVAAGPPPAPGKGFVSVSERQLADHTAEIIVEGELDLSTAPHLKWPLLDSVKAGRTRLLVNFSGVTFIDSTALSVLVGAHRRLPEAARMTVVCSNPNVLRIFEVSGLDATFEIFPTREEALARLRSQDEPTALAGDEGRAPADAAPATDDAAETD